MIKHKVQDACVYPGMDCGSDHRLILLSINGLAKRKKKLFFKCSDLKVEGPKKMGF